MTTSMATSDDNVIIAPKKNSYKFLLDSDSDEEPEKIITSTVDLEEKPAERKSSSSESNESGQESDNDEAITTEIKHKNRRKNANPKKKIIAPKIQRVLQRKSAAKALDVIKEKMSYQQHSELKQEIQSEKQRMLREQEICVPYHKPKQYSLKEFLARRTLRKPSTIEQLKNGSTVSTIIAMKMASQNIEQFARKMKEREEEAIQFFKSESEPESDDDLKPSENKENVALNPSTAAIAADSEESACGVTAEQIEVYDKPIAAEAITTVNDLDYGLAIEKEREVSSSVNPLDAVPVSRVDEELKSRNKLTTAATNEVSSGIDQDLELDRLRLKYEKSEPNIEHEDATSAAITDVKPKFSLKTLDEMDFNDAVIDLETGKIQHRKMTGPEMLFQRYMRTVQKPKQKDSVKLNILSVENGTFQNQKIEVKLNNEVELDHNRPGLSHELLKQQLRKRIVHKRIEEIKKKVDAEVEANELEPEDKPAKGNEDCYAGEEAANEESDEDMNEEEEEEEDSEGEMENYVEKKRKRGSCAFVEDEAVDEDDSESTESDDEESSEEDISKESIAPPKKGRIIRAFVDSDDEESNLNRENPSKTENEAKPGAEPRETILERSLVVEPSSEVEVAETQLDDYDNEKRSTPRDSEDAFSTQPSDFTFTEPSVSEEMRTQGIKGICDQAGSQMIDDDLLEICSGQFGLTQADPPDLEQSPNFPQNSSEISQFVSQVVELPPDGAAVVKEKFPLKNNRNFLDSSDDEQQVDSAVEKKRKKKKKRKQMTKKLGFSDEEEESVAVADQLVEAEDEGNEELEECLEECEEEEDEADVEAEAEPFYDSEENEIEVEIEKKDRVKAAGKFFEDEAELSESELGSADEDENGLDKFDFELGDEEQFDQNQLQEEVGRIHARTLLDDDIRNVKKIEELLFEDEEVDGVGRERKFHWKNQDKSFPQQDENARDGDQLVDDDFEEEIAWRKMRHERETMLSEQSLNLTESDKMSEEILLLDHNSQVTSSSTCSFSKRRFTVVKTSIGISGTANDAKKESPFLIKAASLKKYQNSSFLSRDEATLSKIARFVSHKSVHDEVSNMSSNTSNSMSFMTVEKPINDNKKRKSDGKSEQEPSKKRRVEGKNLLLDQLK